MHVGEERAGKHPVAGHREKHARGRQHQHEEHRGDAGDTGRRNDELRPRQARLLERIGDAGIDADLLVADHAGEHRHHGDVQHRADHERRNDTNRHIALRVLRFLCVSGHGVEPDVREEDDGGAGDHADRLPSGVHLTKQRVAEEAHARHPERRKRRPVVRVDEERADQNHEQDGGQLHADHGGVEARALLNALHQHNGHDRHDQHCRQVHDTAGLHEVPRSGVVNNGGTAEGGRKVDAEPGQHALEVPGPAVRHGGRSHRVFEHQVPANDPGEQLTQGGVGVGIGRPGDRHHRRELRIAQGREDARHPGEHVREHQGWPGDVVSR